MATESIQLDAKVIAALRAQAEAHQLPLSKYLEELAQLTTALKPTNEFPGEEEWNRILDEASDTRPVAPLKYDREDIYFDHA
jgi:hypothetical protein